MDFSSDSDWDGSSDHFSRIKNLGQLHEMVGAMFNDQEEQLTPPPPSKRVRRPNQKRDREIANSKLSTSTLLNLLNVFFKIVSESLLGKF